MQKSKASSPEVPTWDRMLLQGPCTCDAIMALCQHHLWHWGANQVNSMKILSKTCKIKVLSVYGHINLQGQPRTNTAGDKQSKAVQTNWKTKCHRIILCLGMREPWPEKCWQIKKHRELEQTIGQQRICPDCSELLRRTKVVAARQTLSSTRGFI